MTGQQPGPWLHHPLAVQAQDIQVDLPGLPNPTFFSCFSKRSCCCPIVPLVSTLGLQSNSCR